MGMVSLFTLMPLDAVRQLEDRFFDSGNLVVLIPLLAGVLYAVGARWASNATSYDGGGAGREPPIYRCLVPVCGPLLVMIWDTPSLMSSIASVLATTAPA